MATPDYLDKKVLTNRGESTIFEVGTITRVARGSNSNCEITLKLSYPSRKENSSQYEQWRVTGKHADEAYDILNEGMTIAILGHRRSTVETKATLNSRISFHYNVVDTIDILSTKKAKLPSMRRDMEDIDELLRKVHDNECAI